MEILKRIRCRSQRCFTDLEIHIDIVIKLVTYFYVCVLNECAVRVDMLGRFLLHILFFNTLATLWLVYNSLVWNFVFIYLVGQTNDIGIVVVVITIYIEKPPHYLWICAVIFVRSIDRWFDYVRCFLLQLTVTSTCQSCTKLNLLSVFYWFEQRAVYCHHYHSTARVLPATNKSIKRNRVDYYRNWPDKQRPINRLQ